MIYGYPQNILHKTELVNGHIKTKSKSFYRYKREALNFGYIYFGHISAQFIQTLAFTQTVAIWTTWNNPAGPS